jgi:hypothetical protein
MDFEETLGALLGMVGSRVSVSAGGVDGEPPLALIGHGTLAQGTELSGGLSADADLYLSFAEDLGPDSSFTASTSGRPVGTARCSGLR